MPRRKSTTVAPSAPAPVQSTVHPRYSNTPAFVGAVLIVGSIVIGGAVLLGRSDSGEIDVTAAIQNANQKSVDENGNLVNQVGTPGEQFRNMPNGGLVPQEGGTEEPQPQAESSDTGSSTATSTEDGTEADTTTENPENTEQSGAQTENTPTDDTSSADTGTSDTSGSVE